MGASVKVNNLIFSVSFTDLYGGNVYSQKVHTIVSQILLKS